ncbi:MAG: thioredoxin domain-containing protein [Polyangiaceae bacterium]
MRVTRRESLAALSALIAGPGCAPVRTATIPPNLPRKGAPKPELVVQEVGDYQCPFCAEVQPAVARLMSTHAERIALVWRNYPLASHEHALGAAEAATEVRAELGDDAFWKYHDVLFRNQKALAPADLVRYAEAFPLDQKRFGRALELGIHRDSILSDKAEIASLKLPGFGTPAFLIGADVFVGTYSYEELVELVEQAL